MSFCQVHDATKEAAIPCRTIEELMLERRTAEDPG
jgi:hypothetical protein